MKKTKEFIQSEYDRVDDEYWGVNSEFIEIEKELKLLNARHDSLSSRLSQLDDQRKYFCELLNELNSTENE